MNSIKLIIGLFLILSALCSIFIDVLVIIKTDFADKDMSKIAIYFLLCITLFIVGLLYLGISLIVGGI